MPSKLEEKQKELQLRQLQVLQLQEEIANLSITERQSPVPTLPERHPLGQKVKLTGKNEKYRLRNKKATVTGHTNCYVRLLRKGESFLRAPENLTVVYDGNKEEKGPSG